MSIEFLPTGYKAPKSSGPYLKIENGEYRLRILTAPIVGWSDWTLEKKPLRFRMDAKPAKSIDPKSPIRHFWTFLVWNYLEEKVQILEITQATIRRPLEALSKDNDWGAPYHYDIKITRTGEGKDTEYTVTPLPHKPLAQHIKDAFLERRCNLDALFTGDDPWAPTEKYTKAFFETETLDIEPANSRTKDLQEMLTKCSGDYQKHIQSFLDKNKTTLDNLPPHLFDKLEASIVKHLEEQRMAS